MQASSDELFVSIPDAARLLNISVRTIYRHLRIGRLRQAFRGTSRGVRRDDLEQLQCSAEDPSLPPINKVTLAWTFNKVRVLQREVELLVEAMELRRRTLDLSSDALVERYQAARRIVEDGELEGAWSWIEFLLRLRDGDLKTIERETGDEHPWRPFYELAGAIRGSDGESVDRLVGAACTHIEQLCHAWIVMKCGPRLLRRHARDLVAGSPLTHEGSAQDRISE